MCVVFIRGFGALCNIVVQKPLSAETYVTLQHQQVPEGHTELTRTW